MIQIVKKKIKMNEGDLIMIKKTIEYVDYNGENRKEEFYFNLSKAEVMELEMSKNGGLSEYIQRIVKSSDNAAIMSLFKEIICKAYGEKSLDGKRFIKNKELTDAFVQTEAYSELFMELATNADEAAAFINGIIPKNMNVENK